VTSSAVDVAKSWLSTSTNVTTRVPELEIHPINLQRFNALAGYTRNPLAMLAADEVSWFSAGDEALLIVIMRDHTDDDYAAMFFARDLRERYRWISMTEFVDTEEAALELGKVRVDGLLADLESERVQGDEVGKPVDFFTPVVPDERLHPSFVALISQEKYSPAFEMIKPMMRWYEDADGNFVEQFQTTGFDTRIWELYLFATLVEAGYAFDRSHAVPDFVVRGLSGQMSIEATSANPSRDGAGNVVAFPEFKTNEELSTFERHYMPIRFAGPLTAKLKKRYWLRPNVEGNPFLIAVQDFHSPRSMGLSGSALPIYLYGWVHDERRDARGRLLVVPQKIDVHRWGSKEVASSFFSQEGAENVSAVLANPGATLLKFNRMGAIAGFGSKRVRMIRRGLAADSNPNASEPREFEHDVYASGYSESWVEGMDVFHNPAAKIPLDPWALLGASHHTVHSDGQVETLTPEWHPLSSKTFLGVDEGQPLTDYVRTCRPGLCSLDGGG